MRFALAALSFLAAPGLAHAQAYQCQLPQAAPSAPVIRQDGETRRTPVKAYTLALSWSPEYCRGKEANPGDRSQCSPRNGRFGFIVHGLWPEGSGGNWPQWCRAGPPPAPATIRQSLCMTPSARLMAHEWAKHGSCMARKPESYFKITGILWRSLRWPDYDRISRKPGLTAGDIRQAFVNANPDWKPAHIGLVLNRRGWLQEMQLCYGKDFMPTPCDKRRYGPSDKVPAKIWRGL